MNTQLSPELMLMAERLAERHRIPPSPHVHPKVLVPDGRGGIDSFMSEKLRELENGNPYVPYCLVGSDCARPRRTEWGFQCPHCGNKMNWDLTHFDGNKNVQYEGPPPPVKPLSIKEWNELVSERKQARARARVERK